MSANVWSQVVEVSTFLSLCLCTPWSVEVAQLSMNVTLTLSYHECCTIFPARWPRLALSLFVTDPASGSGAEGRSVHLFCCLLSVWLRPDAGSSAEAYTSSVKLLSKKSLMETYVVYLSISFMETLSAHQCLWQRALCGVAHRKDSAESVTPPLHSLFQTEGLCWSFHHSPIEGIQL